MRSRWSGLALLAVATLAGCGGASPSLRDLRQDAGLVCRRANRAFQDLSSPGSTAQDASFLTGGADRLRAQLAGLRRLTPPRDVSDVYGAALGALGQELSALRGASAAIHQGEDPGLAYRTLKQQLDPLRSQANDAWQALQVAACLQ